MIQAAGVVIPAHNEEDLLPSCLAAVRRAAGQLTVPVHLVVVADACTDRTAARARDQDAIVVEIAARSVGAARRAGATRVLQRSRHLDPGRCVAGQHRRGHARAPSWLTRQLRYADRGWEGVVGTVAVADWAGHPPWARSVFDRRYRSWRRHHPHVHGANLGFTAAAYLAAGGFQPLCTGEDHTLVDDLQAAGIRLLRTTRIPVVTSARTSARAPRGFGSLLNTLAAADETATDPQGEPA